MKNIFIILLINMTLFCFSEVILKEASENENMSGMVFIEGGTFKMGNNSIESKSNEKPVHEVTINNFYIGIYEVTQKEWNIIMDTNPSEEIGNDMPVHNVSWIEAVKFCNNKSIKEKLNPCYKIIDEKIFNVECYFFVNGYRLPTEAEWEYAAKGGNKSKIYKYSGSNILDEVASIFTKYTDTAAMSGAYFCIKQTYNVGLKNPNELGIYDMSGNINEWCWDWYDEKYYTKNEKENPKGPVNGVNKILRGGYFNNNSNFCRISARNKEMPNKQSFIFTNLGQYSVEKTISFFGFRLVRSKK